MWKTLEDPQFHQMVAHGMLLSSIPTFLVLTFLIDAPWGKTRGDQWWLGPLLPCRLCWFVMELPNLLWGFSCFRRRRSNVQLSSQLLLALFVGHYVNRAVLYPLRQSPSSKRMPFMVAFAAFCFTSVNGYLQSQNLCLFQTFPEDHLSSLAFRSGIALFVAGVSINFHADNILRQLRSSSTKSYQIPRGGLFEYCSAAHYFGEIVEWGGYALACDNAYVAWVFVLYTASNLIPRGISHHRWYNQKFEDYPKERRAVIPFFL